MKSLRIVQGGIENGDKVLLERLAAEGRSFDRWVAPKDSRPGDDVVIYVVGYGFFATATVTSESRPRDDWPGRYGAALASFKLIVPPIFLAAIRRHIPGLGWARYPRSITTPTPDVAEQVRELIRRRRKTGIPDLDDDALEEANIDELRRVATMRSRKSTPGRNTKTVYRARSLAIRLYVLRRADGYCEYCEYEAPFYKSDGTPYLEPHHTTRLADDGPDHPSHVIALCPNCHRRAHHAGNAKAFNSELKALLHKLEPR
jgi:5-methylcytosine-specific restriction endonuclease McrA